MRSPTSKERKRNGTVGVQTNKHREIRSVCVWGGRGTGIPTAADGLRSPLLLRFVIAFLPSATTDCVDTFLSRAFLFLGRGGRHERTRAGWRDATRRPFFPAQHATQRNATPPRYGRTRLLAITPETMKPGRYWSTTIAPIPGRRASPRGPPALKNQGRRYGRMGTVFVPGIGRTRS